MTDHGPAFREFVRLCREESPQAGFRFLAGLPGDELAGLVQAYREGVIG